MIEFCDSPYSFVKKIFSELNLIPDSSWIFFSNEMMTQNEKILPPGIEEHLTLSAYNFSYVDSLRFQFQFFNGNKGDVTLKMTKLLLEDECLATYLTIDNYSQLDFIAKWIDEMSGFWILENQEALFYRESGLTVGYRIKSQSKLDYFALDEIKAMDVLQYFKSES